MNSVDLVVSTVKEKVANGTWQMGQRLPSVQELSALCKVSKRTISRAVIAMKHANLIHGPRGGRIFAGPLGAAHETSPINGQLWQRVKSRLIGDLQSGAGNNVLPLQPGKLATRYQVSFRTMRKALRSMTVDGLLVEKGRGYQQAPVIHRYRPSTILIAAGHKDSGISTFSHRTEGVVNSYEREADRFGFTALCRGFDENSSTELLEITNEIKKSRLPAGAIINLWYPGTVAAWKQWMDLLHFLTKKEIPVVVLDQDGALAIPPHVLRHEQLRVLRIAGERAGYMVGAALFKQGHHEVAFISPYAEPSWVKNRFIGLNKFSRACGVPGARARFFALSEVANQLELTLAFLDLSAQDLRILFRDWSAGEEFSTLIDRATAIREEHAIANLQSHPKTKTIKDLTNALLGMASRPHDVDGFREMLTFLLHHASMHAQDLYLRPFLRSIFTKCKASAWVCAEEQVTISAKSFLAESKIRVPQEIALIGFENWRGSHEQQLSVYDFNMPGMVNEALLMIREPKVFAGKPKVCEVDGYVVERKTTR